MTCCGFSELTEAKKKKSCFNFTLATVNVVATFIAFALACASFQKLTTDRLKTEIVLERPESYPPPVLVICGPISLAGIAVVRSMSFFGCNVNYYNATNGYSFVGGANSPKAPATCEQTFPGKVQTAFQRNIFGDPFSCFMFSDVQSGGFMPDRSFGAPLGDLKKAVFSLDLVFNVEFEPTAYLQYITAFILPPGTIVNTTSPIEQQGMSVTIQKNTIAQIFLTQSVLQNSSTASKNTDPVISYSAEVSLLSVQMSVANIGMTIFWKSQTYLRTTITDAFTYGDIAGLIAGSVWGFFSALFAFVSIVYVMAQLNEWP